jgi:tryptophan synthase beta chain
MTTAEAAVLADPPGPGPAVMGDPGPGGRFGPFGGRFVPEALIPACEELESSFRSAWADPGFRAELGRLLAEYAGRPTPLTAAPQMSAELGVQVLLKREDLTHTGSHKINNVAGQALLARRMGKTALVAETGAGQHGVAAATMAAHLGLACTVYMGERDMARQELNVFRMELLGATVVPVRAGSRTLKDATNEALRHWVTAVHDTHYCIGSVLGPHPYPWLVRELQRVIGDEARAQCAALAAAGRLAHPVPDAAVACVGGGSNAAGTFAGFAGYTGRPAACHRGADPWLPVCDECDGDDRHDRGAAGPEPLGGGGASPGRRRDPAGAHRLRYRLPGPGRGRGPARRRGDRGLRADAPGAGRRDRGRGGPRGR